MKVSKEFWISDNHFDNIINNRDCHITIRSKNESAIQGIQEKAKNKITITYEIDREITIKESEFEKILERLHISNNDLAERAIGRSLRYELFGGGENE